MTHFHIELDLTCPSGWNEQKVREYIERICPTQEEKDSIGVSGPECHVPLPGGVFCVLPLDHPGDHLYIQRGGQPF